MPSAELTETSWLLGSTKGSLQQTESILILVVPKAQTPSPLQRTRPEDVTANTLRFVRAELFLPSRFLQRNMRAENILTRRYSTGSWSWNIMFDSTGSLFVLELFWIAIAQSFCKWLIEKIFFIWKHFPSFFIIMNFVQIRQRWTLKDNLSESARHKILAVYVKRLHSSNIK